MEETAYVERELEKDIIKWIDSREIIAIRGPRQAGKTTLLEMIMRHLRKKECPQEKIHYVSMEDDSEKEKFEKNPTQYIEYHTKGKKESYFFIDEIQYVANAGKILKLLFDNCKVKFIITGSSSLEINRMGKYLVGRVIFFDLYPFSFEELIKAKDETMYNHYLDYSVRSFDKKPKESIFFDKIEEYWVEYITYGGYPRVVLEPSTEKKEILLKNIFATYIEKDIVSLYGPRIKQRISEVLKYLASAMGSTIKYEDIASITGLYYKEIKELISLLEDTFVIRQIKPFHRSKITELKKNPKIYFIDLGLRNSVLERFVWLNHEFGPLLECFMSNRFRLRTLNYWRTTAKAEVDFIIGDPLMPIETKCVPKITKSLRSFINTYKPKAAVIATRGVYGEKSIGKTKVFIVPAAMIRGA